ncbi:MAG: hypothetical protein OEX19_05650 [Gammaproteobacteria bacterium]|nr:hypothetical protein [Gammaproteobacteria bacterium]
MKKISSLILVLFFLLSCAQQYYLKSSLNNISIGNSKQQLLALFPGQGRVIDGGAPPLQIRSAKKHNGKLIEIGELLMSDGVSAAVPHWFLFEDGELVQWGQPQDWKEVKARYEINYNPPVGVTY